MENELGIKNIFLISKIAFNNNYKNNCFNGYPFLKNQ